MPRLDEGSRSRCANRTLLDLSGRRTHQPSIRDTTPRFAVRVPCRWKCDGQDSVRSKRRTVEADPTEARAERWSLTRRVLQSVRARTPRLGRTVWPSSARRSDLRSATAPRQRRTARYGHDSAPAAETLPDGSSGFHRAILFDGPPRPSRGIVAHLSGCTTRPWRGLPWPPGSGLALSCLPSMLCRASRSPATTAFRRCGRRIRDIGGRGLDSLLGFGGRLAAQCLPFRPVERPLPDTRNTFSAVSSPRTICACYQRTDDPLSFTLLGWSPAMPGLPRCSCASSASRPRHCR